MQLQDDRWILYPDVYREWLKVIPFTVVDIVDEARTNSIAEIIFLRCPEDDEEHSKLFIQPVHSTI